MTVTEVSIMNFATSLLIFTWFHNNCSLFSERILPSINHYFSSLSDLAERQKILDTGMCSRRTKQIAQQLHWWAVQDWTTPSSNSFRTIKQIQNALMKSTRIAQWKLTFTLFEVNDIDLNFITKYPWYFYSVNTWNSLKFDLSYGPWNSVLKSLLTGLWPFFFNVD